MPFVEDGFTIGASPSLVFAIGRGFIPQSCLKAILVDLEIF